MNFFAQLRQKLQSFMQGRNGFDILSRDLSLFALALMLLDAIIATEVIYLIGVLILLFVIFRICSKNITKRAAENNTYIAFRTPIIQWFKTKWQQFKSRKDFRYYKCTGCHQRLRVPRGKGKIEICCPKCGKKFIKKT